MELDFNLLEVVHPNMAELSRTDQKQFALLRRVGLGASDSSVYMGVNIWTTVEQLIEQKLSKIITPEEIAIGEKSVVRKGAELEPLILQKFSAFANGMEVVKPSAMYRIIEHPQLTINYDGIIKLGEHLIPVEAKMCSIYAEKHWDKTKTISTIMGGAPQMLGGNSAAEHITLCAEAYGIPNYYYTQIQQQMLGLNAPFGYFAVLFDKEWEFKVYKIFADSFVQQQLITESKLLWDKITQARDN